MSQIRQPSWITVTNSNLYTPFEIEKYEEQILHNPNVTEHDASRFFAQYPKFLLVGSAKELRREIVFHSNNVRKVQRVDFFRRNFGTSYWDIVELKDPKNRLVSGTKTRHPYLASSVTKAISQAEDYRDLIVEDQSLRAYLLQLGIAVLRPRITVVVGQQSADVTESASSCPSAFRIMFRMTDLPVVIGNLREKLTRDL